MSDIDFEGLAMYVDKRIREFYAKPASEHKYCTVCGSRRLTVDETGKEFGACSLVSDAKGEGGCPDPMRDYYLELKQRKT
jgi:hypothetical protein